MASPNSSAFSAGSSALSTSSNAPIASIGVPTEIKRDEQRVALTPDGVRELVSHGLEVRIQSQAGAGAGISDGAFAAAGAQLVSAEEAWAARLVVKVKEPQPQEFAYLRQDQVLFTYLHLAAYPEVGRALLEAGTTAVAYETVQLDDGSLPLLAPMSEIAGRLAAQVGAHLLERPHGGRGVLMGGCTGVQPARVVVLGAGTVGWHAARIAAAKRPVIIAGIELHRYGLQADAVALAEKAGIPIAATMLAKSVVSEVHPLYIGLYEGAMGRHDVTEFVEESDCVILLGTILTDIDLGIFTAKLDAGNSIFASCDKLRISHHYFDHVLLADFIRALVAAKPRGAPRPLPPGPAAARGPYVLQPDTPITTRRLVRRLDESLDDRTIVIADVGDALFASSELVIRGQTEYIAPAYYTSMGFAVPAALGAQMARPDLKVVVLVGDGAFQMTGMELSTIVRRGLPVTVIVLDNKGYGTERLLLEGSFNDINPWQYQLLPQVLGGGTGWEVRTEGEFDAAITRALADTSGMNIIRVHIGLEDRSTTLDRLAAGLAKKVAR